MNEDKGSAKFNKSKKSLVITLPVLPLPRPPPAPHRQDRPLVTELTSTDESSEQTNELEENESCDTNENVTEDEQREKVESWAQMVKDWSSVGEWQVPPFNYHQDDSTVSFVLYTSGVKKASMVSHFDEHQVSMCVVCFLVKVVIRHNTYQHSGEIMITGEFLYNVLYLL